MVQSYAFDGPTHILFSGAMSDSLDSTSEYASEMAAFPEMNPGPVVRTDLLGRIHLLNEAARAVFGAAAHGKTWPDACPGVNPDLWRKVLAGKDGLQQDVAIGQRHFTFVYRRPDGIESVFIYGSDITARKRDEEMLAVQSAQIAEMARFPEMNPGPVFRVDLMAKVLLANAAARALFGGESLLGQCWKDLCPGLDAASWNGILDANEVTVIEAKVDDRTFLFAHRMEPDGKMVFVYGNDVTSLRAAEEALRQSERMATLGTLAAGVAHELNNPAAAAKRATDELALALAKLQEAAARLGRLDADAERTQAVRGMVDGSGWGSTQGPIDPLQRNELEADIESWLDEHGVPEGWDLAPSLVSAGCTPSDLDRVTQQWGADGPPIVEWIARARSVRVLADQISRAATRVSDIVGTLKSYTFLDQVQLRTVDVVAGIEDTLRLLRTALELGVTVEREYAPDLPTIEAMGSELNQVWTHLMRNAIDAMGGHGKVTIRTRRESRGVAVEIEDNGPGIPEAIRPRVFDAFFTTKPPGKGTGMGLATCRNIIVKDHGGTIDVSSSPGCTIFTVRLPPHRQPG